jgi:hypothetical protein
VQLKKLTLKSNPDYWVEVVTDLKYGDLKSFASMDKDGGVDFAASADVFLQTIIKNWNLDDDAGTVLPVTPENINRLSQADALLIMNEATALVDTEEQKKTSSLK